MERENRNTATEEVDILINDGASASFLFFPAFIIAPSSTFGYREKAILDHHPCAPHVIDHNKKHRLRDDMFVRDGAFPPKREIAIHKRR